MSHERPEVVTVDDLADDLAIVNTKTRALLLAFRQALIMVLGAIEVYLNYPRSIVPKHERK